MNNKIPKKKVIVKNFDGDNTPEEFEFPSIGIEDIDRAVFNLFDSKLKIEITSKGETRQVPVIFATGERFALTRRKKPLRDKNNTNILPLISIVRENIDIGPGQSGKGTAISFRAQPNYYIKKRLAEKDREFQNFINKQNIVNQENVTSNKKYVDTSTSKILQPGASGSSRSKKNLKFSAVSSVQLKNDINTNIYELIQVPYPYFVAMTYNVTFWCQYMMQGNQMIEYLLNQVDVPGGEFAIKTKSGYELVAFLDQSINFSNNFDGMTDDERIIKYSFNLTVPGYLINSKVPGLPVQTRSYTSAPQIDFTYYNAENKVERDYQPETKKENVERHVLGDITSVDELILQRGENVEKSEEFVENPFNNTGESAFLKIKNTNSRAGESVLSPDSISKIDRQFE